MSSTCRGPDGKEVTEQYQSSTVGDAERRLREQQEMYTNSGTGLDKMALERTMGEQGEFWKMLPYFIGYGSQAAELSVAAIAIQVIRTRKICSVAASLKRMLPSSTSAGRKMQCLTYPVMEPLGCKPWAGLDTAALRMSVISSLGGGAANSDNLPASRYPFGFGLSSNTQWY